ncbi:MAG TPA: cytochrome P450, partial [Mycobacteriales bacterium]|nr:cytochrome P450 [Mycobacteriales bacterium]
MRTTSGSHAQLFALEPATVRCPYAALADLRSEPVRYVPGLAAFVVSGHSEVLQVLADQEQWSSRNPTGPSSATGLARRIQADEIDLGALPPGQQAQLQALARRRAAVASAPALISADPPLHAEQRTLVEQLFTPDRLAVIEPFAHAVAEELVGVLAKHTSAELIAALCRPLPVRVVARLLGLDDADPEVLQRWSDAHLRAVGTDVPEAEGLLEMFQAISDSYDWLTARLEKASESASDDFVSRVAAYCPNARPVQLPERLQILTQLMVAGQRTTTNALAAAALRIAVIPGLESRLRDDMSRLPEFVDEVLRLEPPSTGLYRLATRSTRLGGVDVPAGSYAFISYHAANLDPDGFAAPEELRFDRPDKPRHLSFGGGPHRCPAEPLARLMVTAALEQLLRQVSDLRLAVEPQELTYHPSWAIRGPVSLPMLFNRATAPVDGVTQAEHRPMVVDRVSLAADRIIEVVLSSPSGQDLP